MNRRRFFGNESGEVSIVIALTVLLALMAVAMTFSMSVRRQVGAVRMMENRAKLRIASTGMAAAAMAQLNRMNLQPADLQEEFRIPAPELYNHPHIHFEPMTITRSGTEELFTLTVLAEYREGSRNTVLERKNIIMKSAAGWRIGSLFQGGRTHGEDTR